MEKYDAQKAARVWERVHAGMASTPETDSLLRLIAEEWTDAATYLHLSRKLQGKKEAAVLRRLFEEEQTHAACLKGIYTLITGQRPVTHTPHPATEPLDATLRRCYGREMRCLAEYEQRTADREYGPVFSRLAQQEREHCSAILQLIGTLQKQG